MSKTGFLRFRRLKNFFERLYCKTLVQILRTLTIFHNQRDPRYGNAGLSTCSSCSFWMSMHRRSSAAKFGPRRQNETNVGGRSCRQSARSCSYNGINFTNASFKWHESLPVADLYGVGPQEGQKIFWAEVKINLATENSVKFRSSCRPPNSYFEGFWRFLTFWPIKVRTCINGIPLKYCWRLEWFGFRNLRLVRLYIVH